MSIKQTLEAWGSAKAIDKAPNGYPSINPIAKMMGNGDVGMPPIDIDLHNRIDAIVSAMRETKPDHHRVLVTYYVKGQKSDSKVARALTTRENKVTRGAVASLRNNAEGYVEAKLDD